jgi:hypothetical protein
MTYDPTVSLGALLHVGGMIVTLIVVYTQCLKHGLVTLLGFLALLLVVVTLAWGGEDRPTAGPSPTWGTDAPPRVWTPDLSRDPRAGDSLLRPPTGDSTGRSLLAPPPVYRPTPYPDQRGRPLMRER